MLAPSLQAAAEWRSIGLQLKLLPGTLDAIHSDQKRVIPCLEAVFTKWRRNHHPPYAWKTILNVLASNVVGQKRLGDDIAHKLTHQKTMISVRTTSVWHALTLAWKGVVQWVYWFLRLGYMLWTAWCHFCVQSWASFPHILIYIFILSNSLALCAFLVYLLICLFSTYISFTCYSISISFDIV